MNTHSIETLLTQMTGQVSQSLANRFTLLQFCKSDMTEERYANGITELAKEFNNELTQKTQTEDKNNKSDIISYLCSASSFFTEEKDFFDQLDASNSAENGIARLIVGSVQCGKSGVICGIAIYNTLVLKKTTVIIVRNLTGDYDQLANKFLSDGVYGQFGIPVVYAGDKDTQVLSVALRNIKPMIIIAIAHPAQILRINRVVNLLFEDEKIEAQFDIVLDEADDLGFKLRMDKPFITQFDILKELAQNMFAITATAFDVMFMEDELANNKVYKMIPPNNYKGVDYIQFNPVPVKMRTGIERFGRVVNLETEMLSYYLALQEQPIFESVLSDGSSHPTIVLHKVETRTNEHMDFVKCFASTPELNQVWTAIMYNGTGVWIYSSSLVGRKIVITGVKSKVVSSELYRGLGILEFKKLSINAVLQYLRDSDPTVERFSKIVIASGRMATRGINFVSSDYKWHLTHQFLTMSPTSSSADLVQAIRLCGCYDDAIPLELSTTQKDINNLRQAYATQSVLLDGCMDVGNDSSVVDTYGKIPVFTDLIPKRKLSKKTYYDLNKVVRNVNGNVDEKRSEEETGFVSYENESQRAIYEALLTCLRGMNMDWQARGDIIRQLPTERTWDQRQLTAMHYARTMNHSSIRWKKVANRVFYRLN